MNKAKLVVETWDRQFHSSPREQRLAFLYLANDILQNSRRKGAEFVGEFWRVLPEALRDVIRNGDDFGRSAALRLVSLFVTCKWHLILDLFSVFSVDQIVAYHHLSPVSMHIYLAYAISL